MARTKTKAVGSWRLDYSDPLAPGTIESWAAGCAQNGRDEEAQQGRDLANEIRASQAQGAQAEDAPDPSRAVDIDKSAADDPAD